MKFVFVAVVLVWMFIGFLAGLWAREDGIRSGVAWALFVAIVPMLPLIANICGLI